MYRFDTNGQMTMLGLDTAERGGAPPKRRPGKPDSELVSIPYFHLDLLSSPVDLFGQRHWELRSPWREGKRPQSRGRAPPPDPRLTVWHTGSVPVSKVLFIENSLSGHPAPRL